METGAKVVYAKNCKSYLNNLAYKLFEKDYFGFLINAKDYVERIFYFDTIKARLY